MKRLIIKAVSVVCFIAALGFASPADAKQRDVTPGTFTGIDVSDNFIVTVSRGTSFSVTLNVDDALDDYVTCHVRNQVLILALDEKKVPKDIKANYKGKNGFSPVLNAYVTVPDYIQSVTVSGKATFSDFGDVLGGVSVNVSVSDQGAIKHMAIANSQNVSIKTENRSNAVISVEAESVILDQGGSSVVDLTQTSTTCEISVLGSGSLVVRGDCGELKYSAKGGVKTILNGSALKAIYNCSGSTNTNASNLRCEEAAVTMNGICSLSEAASQKLSINMSGSSSLTFAGEPVITIENIKSSTVTRAQ